MKELLGKVLYYTKAAGRVEVSFPEDRTVCQWCPFCKSENSLKRWRCTLTEEFLIDPFFSVGNKCPLELVPNNDKEGD